MKALLIALLLIATPASAEVIRWADGTGNVAEQDGIQWRWVSLLSTEYYNRGYPPNVLTTAWDDIGQIPGAPDYGSAIWALDEVEPPYKWDMHGGYFVLAANGPDWDGEVVHAWTTFNFLDNGTVQTSTYRRMYYSNFGDFYSAVPATLHQIPEPSSVILACLAVVLLATMRPREKATSGT